MSVPPVIPPQTPLQELIHGPLTDRWQPVSPASMRYLLDHATERGSPQSSRTLRYRNGKPITSRRSIIFGRESVTRCLGSPLKASACTWLRHTTLMWVERSFSYAVAREYAGHRSKHGGTTATHV